MPIYTKAARDKQIIASEANSPEKNFWMAKLSKEHVITHFPIVKIAASAGAETPSTATVIFELEGALFQELLKVGNNSDHKLHIILSAAVAVLMAKCTSPEDAGKDVLILVPIYKPDIEGEFINTMLPLRIHHTPEMTFKEILKGTGRTLIEAIEHQNYPVEILFDHLSRQDRPSTTAAPGVAVLLENIHEPQFIRHIDTAMTFSFQRQPAVINGKVEYNCAALDKPRVEAIVGYLILLLETMAFNLDSAIGNFSILPGDEKIKWFGPSTGKTAVTLPMNDVEAKLLDIWADVLGLDKNDIDINANFFQLNGNSLQTIMLISLIFREFDVKMTLADFFNGPQITQLASYINNARKTTFETIEPVEKREYYALSSAQKRLYFLQQLDLNRTSYNMPMVLALGQGIKKDKLEFALKQLIIRHESLRTSFQRLNNEVVQGVHDSVAFEIEYFATDATDVTDDTDEHGQTQTFLTNFIRPFDLSKAPLMRSGLIALPDGNHVWIVDIHHIVSDGTSHMILTEDFMRLYETGVPLEPLPLQYKDFSQWQNRLFAGGEIKNQEDYWLQLYAGEIPRLNLATDFKRPEVFTFEGDRYEFKLGKEDAVEFKDLGARYGGTLYMNMLATLNALFYKYTGQTDIIIGSSIAGRRHVDIQGVVGMFVNSLGMRNYPAGEKTYENFLKEVADNSLKAFENQDVQFEELVEKLDPERDPSRNPIFDIDMVVQNIRQANGRLQLEIINENHPDSLYKNKTSKFDLTFFVSESKEEVDIGIEYYTGIFKEETIERLANHFMNVIKTVIKNPAIAIKDIDILSEKEKERLLYEFNDTGTVYPGDKTIHGLIEEQVARTPDYAAIVYKDQTVTYRELDRHANRLARYLIEDKKVRIGEPVGVWMSQPLYFQAALIAILKAGGAFVPIDPVTPAERIKYIMDDARIGVVISEKHHLRDLNRLQWECAHLHSYLCSDSVDIYAEEEQEKNQLMDRELWHHVGENATDEITGGGWLSSYTGLPFSRAEMDEYGDNTLKKLEPLLHPGMKVLEIGCASGITMYRIAPKVGLYYGTDLSEVIIEKNKQQVQEKGFHNIQLACLPAHEIHQIPINDFDMVIINSVIQGFHGHQYLRKTLQKAIALLGDSGYLFIGDVMDQEKKNVLIRELTAFKEANRHMGYTTKTDFSAELFVSKGFWHDLKPQWSEIKTVTCSDKRYTIENELTKFRYDVLVEIDKTGKLNDNLDKIYRPRLKYQDDMRSVSPYAGSRQGLNIPVDSLAYIIYTSGSTGQPKGVMVEHRSLVNYTWWAAKCYVKGERVNFPLFTSISFDLTITSIFTPLITGNATVVYVKNETDNALLIEKVMAEDRVGVVKLTPSHLQITGEIPTYKENRLLKRFIVGGEILDRQLALDIHKVFKGKVEIYNEYGPTEATVGCMIYKFDPLKSISVSVPIGIPGDNMCIYILDKHLGPVPMGVIGEIYVSGAGVARGYLNQPGLTAEKFKFNRPYKSNRTHIFYKTNDLARRLPDGNIEFLGRIDQQVKIRGFRIELGEIESRLMKHPDIKEASVLAQEGNGDKYLCAYIVFLNESAISGLREFLAKELPDYMIPSYFVQLEKIPLMPNGKIDRKLLPGPGLTAGAGYIAPQDEIENNLVKLWAGILGRDACHVLQLQTTISIDDNFFQLGGHSLKATILISKIHKEFDVKIPLAQIFKTPQIKELAKYIKEAKKEFHISIEPAEDKEYYALSPAQKRLYILQQLVADNTGYNMPIALPLNEGEESITREKLESVFKRLIARHESLRTSFITVNEIPVQKIHREVDFSIGSYNYEAAGESDINSLILDFTRPFRLDTAPLLRVNLFTLGVGISPRVRRFLFIDMHHIITDGTSQGILAKEFRALLAGEVLQPLRLRLQYKDYSEWYNNIPGCKENEINRQELYWLTEFSAETPVLDLPIDYPRPSTQSFEGNTVCFSFNAVETGVLQAIIKEHKITLYMALSTIFNILLAKLSGQEDIIIGTPIAARRHSDLDNVIGMFVNTLAMRNFPSGEKELKEFFKEVRTRTLAAYENQEYPFEVLVDKITVERDMSRNPLFDVMFNLLHQAGSQNDESKQPGQGPYRHIKGTSKFDMNLTAVEFEERLLFSLEYSTRLFKPGTIERIIEYYKNIVNVLSQDTDLKIAEIEIMGEVEKEEILRLSNGVEWSYEGKTIHGLFAEQVSMTPDRIALVGTFEGEAKKRRSEEVNRNAMHLSYRELNERSGKLAGLLIERGVLPETIVAIMMTRSVEMITGILGILKSGGAYLPVDSEYPQERIDYMLKDSSVKLLVTANNIEVAKMRKWEGVNVLLNHLSFHHSPFTIHHSSNLAYIIYTSGSTGKPKGVMVEHRAVHNFMAGIAGIIEFKLGKTILALTTITFDIFGLETLLPFCRGLKVVMADENHQRQLALLEELIIKNCVDMVQATPTRMQMFTMGGSASTCLRDLKEIMVGGEVFPDKLREDLKRFSSAKIYNMYGPTETTIWSSAAEVTKPEKITIGLPINNTQIYILDKYAKIQPMGTAGEVYIGGEGLARGYINHPELTAEKFISFPNFRTSSLPNFPLYRTGDLARRLPDGKILFSGRIDHQVKIRGYRIELGEIEKHLLKHEKIKEAVVLANEEIRGDKYLAVYFVSNVELSGDELREHLLKNLPDYMVPSYFVQLGEIPLTPNGKVNRKALPVPVFNRSNCYTAPRDEIETKLVEIWSEVLGRDNLHSCQLHTSIGIDDHFFQLGGHSLKATIMAGRVEKVFNVKIPLAEIFKNPRIKELSRYIKDAAQWKYEEVEPAEKKEYYVLSSAQTRLHFLQQMDKSGTAYNISAAWILEGVLDKNNLEDIFIRLVKRHESFRTSFVVIGEDLVQRIHDDVEFELDKNFAELFKKRLPEEGRPPEVIIKSFMRSFDLSKAPLMRVGLIEIEKDCYILLVDMHHIISDGVSIEVLAQEFSALYAGRGLPGITLRYRDYAEWQNRERKSKKVLEQCEFWIKEYEGEIPVFALPTDYARPSVQAFEGTVTRFELDMETSGTLKTLALETGTTLYTVLLSIYTILLSKLSGQEDIIIGTPVGGRRHANLEKIIGMFVNTLALRNYPSGKKKFVDFLGEVKERTLKAFENQEYQYEDLVEKVVVKRDVSRNPLFDTMFSLQHAASQQIEIPGLKLIPCEYEKEISIFDLSLSVVEIQMKLLLIFQYNTQLFKQDTIEKFMDFLRQIIYTILNNREIKIEEIKIKHQYTEIEHTVFSADMGDFEAMFSGA